MKISEFITELESLKTEHGDIEIRGVDSCGCCAGDANAAAVFMHGDNKLDDYGSHFKEPHIQLTSTY